MYKPLLSIAMGHTCPGPSMLLNRLFVPHWHVVLVPLKKRL